MMHDVPSDLLLEVLECNLCKLRRKNILNQVRVAFSDLVAYT
jgi:hypothetical protein